jgi:hypothetical protein
MEEELCDLFVFSFAGFFIPGKNNIPNLDVFYVLEPGFRMDFRSGYKTPTVM